MKCVCGYLVLISSLSFCCGCVLNKETWGRQQPHKNGQAIYGCLNPKHYLCNHGGTADYSTKPWIAFK